MRCAEELKDIAVFPGDEDYNASYMLFDPSYDDVQPTFVAIPETVEDVQRCLQCSAANAVPCVVKSGGHSNAGYSTIDGSIHNGFVVYLAKLNRVRVSGDTVVAQAGAWWEDVYLEMNATSEDHLITGGSCSSVGVGGYTLGAGRSVLSRKYGLAIDNVVSMTMVTADGERVVVADATINPDLFWALRGGGGGNFGVVTEITFKSHKVDNPWYSTIEIVFEPEVSYEALIAIGSINPLLPRELNMHFFMTGNGILIITAVYLGSGIHALQYLEPLVDLASTYEVTEYNSYYEQVLNAYSPSMGHYERGCLLSNIDEGFVSILSSLTFPSSCILVFDQLGGEIADISPEDTSFFYREAKFEGDFGCTTITNETLEFLDTLHASLETAGYCLGSFLNVMDRRLDHWQEKYYGDNYPRLLEIKSKWNPIDKGYFHFPQEIGSDYHY